MGSPNTVSAQMNGALENTVRAQMNGALENTANAQMNGALENTASAQMNGALENTANAQMNGALEKEIESVQDIPIYEPGMDIKPRIAIETVPDLVSKLYGFETDDIKPLPSYDDQNFFFKVKSSSNQYVQKVDDNGYVFKIMNTMDSVRPFYVEGQHALLKHVRDGGIPSQEMVPNLAGKEWSLETLGPADCQCGPYVMRVVSFIPGKILYDTPYLPGTLYNVGKAIGKLHLALNGFHHRFYASFTTLWSLSATDKLVEYLEAVRDPDNRQVINEVIEAFTTEVVPNYPYFKQGVIHGDINDQNILVREVSNQESLAPEKRVHDVCAIIDWSDSTDSYLIFDLAINIAYMCIESQDELQLDVPGHVMTGYMAEAELNETEVMNLKICICARLCQTLVMGAYNFVLHPENEYLLLTSKRGWSMIHKLWKSPNEDLVARWKTIQNSYEKSQLSMRPQASHLG